jgi:hypothetical protein
MLRIISSPEGSMWYLPSDRKRKIRNVSDLRMLMLKVKVCKLHAINGTDSEWRYISTHLLFPNQLEWADIVTTLLIYSRERPGNHCSGNWFGLEKDLNG